MMNEELVKCTGLCRSFETVQALRGVDLTLTSGKIVGLLGPNGSGKTTLIKILNGLLQPSAGEARIAGFKPGVETKAITSQTRINAAIIRPPPYRNRSLLMAITSSTMGVSRLRIARIAYSQRKGSRKNLPVSIYLSTGSKNEKNLLSFIRIEDFKVNTSQ